jgi:hypothetical protein
MFSLVSGLPSTASAGGCPLLFGCFVGTTPLSDSPSPCMWVLSLIAFSHRSAAVRFQRTVTGPLGSRAWSFYACMGSLTPQGDDALALTHAALLPSSLCDAVGFSLVDGPFRSSIPSLHIPLSNASIAVLRPPPHDSRPGWFATPYPV